jgi:hypothetical protein
VAHSDPTLKYFDVPYHISSEIASVFSLNSKIKNESGGLKLLAATVHFLPPVVKNAQNFASGD